MAIDNKGFLYESKINKLLKKYKIQSSSFTDAGSDSNAPDAEIVIRGVTYKMEVKLDLKVDFGQGSLDYDIKKRKWILGGAKTESAQQMREFLTSIKVPGLVDKEWGAGGPPRKFTVPLEKFKQSDVAYDYANFKDRFIDVQAGAVADYYASKKTYYIQIGKYGLYYMGKDPAKLGVPEFNPKLRLRIRLKRGGSTPIYNYRFTTALQAVSLNKSNVDLENVKDLMTISARAKK
jgi:hypothetical protein